MFIDEIVKELNKKHQLVDFLCEYNDYVQNYYDEHDEGSYPVCMAEFYEWEYQIKQL